MKILNLTIIFAAVSILTALLLWISLAVGCSNPQRYLALARAGLLILGLGGCAWGLLWQRIQIVLVGLLLIGVGVLSFFY